MPRGKLETPGHWSSGCICLCRPPPPSIRSLLHGAESSLGILGFGRTNEKPIRSQGCRRAGWGYTPAPLSLAPPFPRQNLGLSYLTPA